MNVNKDNIVRVHEIKSWTDYVEKINELDIKMTGDKSFTMSGGYIFRGHERQDYLLSSKLERNLIIETFRGENKELRNIKELNGPDWYKEKCKEILERFKNHISQIPGYGDIEDEEELWALGRHHGLLTPYLDWTFNPYIATFFAFYELYRKFEFSSTYGGKFQDRKVTVWKLNIWQEAFVEDEFELVVVKSKIGSRINAQQGLFTILKTNKFYDIESYLKSKGLGHHLERFELPYELALEALKHLDVMGLSIFKLFPDFLGAAEQSNIETGMIHQSYYLNKMFTGK